MKSFAQFLTEIHYTDIYPKDFHKFYDKWKKVKKSGDRYWVNFTNNPDTGIDNKTFAGPKSRDHTDPMGIYGFNLAYCINWPADIWYGRGARFLRVIEIVGDPNLLYLQSMTDNDISNFLRAMNLNSTYLKAAKKRYSCNDKQAVFKLSQLKNPEEFLFQKSYSDVKAEIKSGEEQTRFWQGLGFQGLVDEARNQKSAIIHDREPWQAVFFNRKYFKVVDVYELNPKSTYMSVGDLGKSEDEESMKRRLAALIAAQIGDKIKEFSKSKAWTHAGRRIDIEFNFPKSYMDNLNVGEKPHKYSKKYDHYNIKVNVVSEKEEYSYTWDASTKFSEIAKEVGEDWPTLKDNPDFVPEYSRKEMEDKEHNVRMEAYEKKCVKLIKKYQEFIEPLAKMYKVKWEAPTNDKEWFRSYIEASHVQRVTNSGKTFEDYIEGEKTAWEGYKSQKKPSKAADQMLALLDKIYHDNTKFMKKGYINGNKDKYHQEPVQTTIADEVKHLSLRHGWFSDDEWLIFKDVLEWKTQGKGD